MYELHQVGENTFYIDCPAKMGVYRTAPDEAVLIDSGNDKEAGKKALRRFEEQGWRLRAVYSTHSNADHIGGNNLLAARTGCPLYAAGLEAAFTRTPILEPSFLYGGYPPKALRNKFLMAQPSEALPLTPDVLPQGLSSFPLPGHFFDMVGFRTDDGVVFAADALVGGATLEKYHVSFVYDVRAYLDSLDSLCAMEASLFVPSHAEPVTDIAPLAAQNRQKIEELLNLIPTLSHGEPATFEELLCLLFTHYGLEMDFNQYVLVGSTLRSYLAYLLDTGRMTASFSQNRLLWAPAQS